MTGTVDSVRTRCRIGRNEVAYAKLQVFPVREVEKLAVLLMYNSGHEIVSPFVLVRVIRHEKGCHATCKGRCHDYRDLCGYIVGSILASESQRPNDISETWARVGQRLLSKYCGPPEDWTTYKKTLEEPHSWSPSWCGQNSSHQNMNTTAASLLQ